MVAAPILRRRAAEQHLGGAQYRSPREGNASFGLCPPLGVPVWQRSVGEVEDLVAVPGDLGEQRRHVCASHASIDGGGVAVVRMEEGNFAKSKHQYGYNSRFRGHSKWERNDKLLGQQRDFKSSTTLSAASILCCHFQANLPRFLFPDVYAHMSPYHVNLPSSPSRLHTHARVPS